MLNYKGYIGHITFDDDADIFHGEVINTRDVITFQGETITELKQGLEDSVDTYLSYCKKKNREPDKPFSGNFTLRTTPDQHRDFMLAARKNGVSLNRWANQVLSEAAQPQGYGLNKS